MQKKLHFNRTLGLEDVVISFIKVTDCQIINGDGQIKNCSNIPKYHILRVAKAGGGGEGRGGGGEGVHIMLQGR